MIRIALWLTAAIIAVSGGWGLLAVSGPASSSAPMRVPGPGPVPSAGMVAKGEPFADRFSALNREIWSISGGWANGRYMVNDWQRAQSQIGDGLRLVLQPQDGKDYAFTSGEVQSRALYSHGYYETTMQAAKGSGLVSGFFTYIGPPFGRRWNEIDVEILGKNTREAVLTYHHLGDSRGKTVPLAFDAADAMHHYAFDWQPGFIRWYIDGELVHEAFGESLALPNEAQKIMMHLWGTDSRDEWAGQFDPAAVPAAMSIRCVAYSADRSQGDRCR